MSDSIDDLLARLDSSVESTSRSKPQLPVSPSQSSNSSPQKSLTQKSPPQKSPPQKSIDHLLKDVALRSQSTADSPAASVSNSSQPHLSSTSTSDDSTDRLLADLKSIYAERDQIEQQAQKQRLQAEQRRQADAQRQHRQGIVQQAADWLKGLNCQSSEAAWFEEFAAKYDSRVEAAIDYLGLG